MDISPIIVAIITGVFGLVGIIIKGLFDIKAKKSEPDSAPHKPRKHGGRTQNRAKLQRYQERAEKKRTRRKRTAVLFSVLGVLAVALLAGVVTAAVRGKQKPPDFDSPDFRLGRGDSFWELAMLEQAQLEYQQAVDMEPSEALNHDKLAQALSEQGKYEEALDEHISAVTLDPDTAMYRFNECVTLTRMERYQDAEREFRRCIKLEPDKAEYHRGLGETLFNLNQVEDALPEIQKAIELNPDDVESRIDLLFTLGRLLRYEEAKEALNEVERTVKQNPTYQKWFEEPEVKEIFNDVRYLLGLT